MSSDHNHIERLLRCLWQTRAMLSDAIDIIAAATGSAGADLTGRPPATAAADPTPPYASLIALPLVGGPTLPCEHTALFSTPDWRGKPEGERGEIFLGRCSGLAALSRLLRLPVSRPGLCGAGQVQAALRALSDARCGVGFRRGGAMASDAGFDDWFPSRLHPRLGPSPMSPVSVGERTLTVVLPADLPWASFRRAFGNRLRRGSLFGWIDTDHGRVHCGMVGADPRLARRYTLDPEGHGRAPLPATALCVLDSSAGADRLIALAETILVEHLLFGVVAEG